MDGIDFFVADPAKYKEEARLRAVRVAREKANTMAAELGQRIGKPWEVSEQVDVDMPTTTNFLMNYKMPMRMPMEQKEPPIAGGEVTLRSTVRASFQLE